MMTDNRFQAAYQFTPLALAMAVQSMLAALILVGMASQANAQSSDDTAPSGAGEGSARQLDAVTVRSRRSIEDRFFAPGSLVVVDRRDIEQIGADTVADVLRQLPGVQVTGGATGSVEIRMRGMERNATQILIDGQRQSGSRRSAQLPFDQLPSEMIERIEIVRAPTAEFSGASGGTINIVLRQATAQRETNIRLTHQNLWNRNAFQGFVSRSGPLFGAAPVAKPAAKSAAASAYTAAEKEDAKPDTKPEAKATDLGKPWTYFIAASANQRLYGGDWDKTSNSSAPNPATAQTHEESRVRPTEFTVIPRVSGRLGPRDQLNLRANLTSVGSVGDFTSRSAGFDTGGATAAQVRDASDYARHLYQLRGDWQHSFAASKLETGLSGSTARERFERKRDQTLTANNASVNTLSAFGDDRREQSRQATIKLTGTASPLLWMTGAELEQRRLNVDTSASVGGGAPVVQGLESNLQRTVLWGQNEWALPARTTLTAGLRAERIAIDNLYNNTASNNAWTFFQPSLHARTPLNENLQIRANISRLTRTPALTDVVNRIIPSQGVNSANNPDFNGNPNLKPESTVTLDTGFEQRLAPQGVWGGSLFVRSVRDVVARPVSDASGRWVQTPVNLGSAIVWGLETDVKSDLRWAGFDPSWSLGANASLLQSRMIGGAIDGQRIPGQARYILSTNIAKPINQRGGWYGGVSLNLQGASDLASSATTSGREHASQNLDVYIGRVVPNLGFWRVGVYNITNAKKVRDRVDISTTGRVTTETSVLETSPRIFLTIGTRF
jgi:outer membrane receptor for ferrienterochelin and colicins